MLNRTLHLKPKTTIMVKHQFYDLKSSSIVMIIWPKTKMF